MLWWLSHLAVPLYQMRLHHLIAERLLHLQMAVRQKMNYPTAKHVIVCYSNLFSHIKWPQQKQQPKMYNENIKSLFKTFANKKRLWRRLATYKNATTVGWCWVKMWTHCSLIKHQLAPSNIAQQDLKHNRRHWTWIIDQLELTCGVCYITSLRESSPIWASEASLPRTRERRAKERRALLSSAPRGFAARSFSRDSFHSPK